MSEAAPASRKTPDDLKDLGNQAFAAKKFEEAIRHYSEAIRLDGGKNHVYFSNRSASYAGLGDWSKAADDAKECIRLDPSFVKGYYRLAGAQIELQDYDKALATIRQGLQVEPNNPQLSKQLRAVRQLQRSSASASASPGAAGSTAAAVPLALPNHRLDEASARELQDLRGQYAQTTREMHSVQASLHAIRQEHRVAELTKSEVETIEGSTKCYRQVGKLFLLSSKEKVVEHLDKQMEDYKKREGDLTSKTDYLERRLKSQKQNIEEIIKPVSSSE